MFLADRLASLNQLSSGISHEICNPLSSIMLYVDILADRERFGHRSEQELQILSEIRENTNRIADTLTRLLDCSRLDIAEKQSVDLNRIIQDTVNIWKPKMQCSGIELRLFLQADLAPVRGDRIELQQVFSNLILNGIEAMPGGGILTIGSRPARSLFHDTREIILVTVSDTGGGIPTDQQESIFHPFFSTKADHTGLGLTIAHQIVRRHGGMLICSSSSKGGTTFSIELNRDEPPESRQG